MYTMHMLCYVTPIFFSVDEVKEKKYCAPLNRTFSQPLPVTHYIPQERYYSVLYNLEDIAPLNVNKGNEFRHFLIPPFV